jgi:hypothetical protein
MLPKTLFCVMSQEKAARFEEVGNVCIFVLRQEHIELGFQIPLQVQKGIPVIIFVQKEAAFFPELKHDLDSLPDPERSKIIIRTWTDLSTDGMRELVPILRKIRSPDPGLFPVRTVEVLGVGTAEQTKLFDSGDDADFELQEGAPVSAPTRIPIS